MFKKTVASITKTISAMVEELDALTLSLQERNKTLEKEVEKNDIEILKAIAVSNKMKELIL